MSLVTFAFMVGGAAGTQLGGRIASATSLTSLYAIYGAGFSWRLPPRRAWRGECATAARTAREAVSPT